MSKQIFWIFNLFTTYFQLSLSKYSYLKYISTDNNYIFRAYAENFVNYVSLKNRQEKSYHSSFFRKIKNSN